MVRFVAFAHLSSKGAKKRLDRGFEPLGDFAALDEIDFGVGGNS